MKSVYRALVLFSVLVFSNLSSAMVREPIRTLEDMMKYLDLSAVYVGQTGVKGTPMFFMAVPNFKMDKFSLIADDGTETDALNSFAYYIKYGQFGGLPANFVNITAQNFKDEMEVAGGHYICLHDQNMMAPYGNNPTASYAKVDILALNHDDPKRLDLTAVDFDSLTKEDAEKALYQLSKGLRHAFVGGNLKVDSTSHSNVVNNTTYPDVLVNKCTPSATGVDAATNQWAPKADANIHTIGTNSGGEMTLYVGWDTAQDKADGKKAKFVSIRGPVFEIVENPKKGTGMIHNADILIKLYNKAGLISDADAQAALAVYADRNK